MREQWKRWIEEEKGIEGRVCGKREGEKRREKFSCFFNMGRYFVTGFPSSRNDLNGDYCTFIQEKCEAPPHKRQELQFQGVSLCHLLVEKDSNWIKDKDKLPMVECLKKVWLNEDYSIRVGKVY